MSLSKWLLFNQNVFKRTKAMKDGIKISPNSWQKHCRFHYVRQLEVNKQKQRNEMNFKEHSDQMLTGERDSEDALRVVGPNPPKLLLKPNHCWSILSRDEIYGRGLPIFFCRSQTIKEGLADPTHSECIWMGCETLVTNISCAEEGKSGR